MTDTYCIDYDDYLADDNGYSMMRTSMIKVTMMSNNDGDGDAMSFSNS